MSEAAQRQAWRAFDSADDAMTEIAFGPAHIKVARPTVPAWNALQTVLLSHDYSIRDGDTHGYFPRNIEGTATRSLHALGIAIDVNATTNPVRKTPNRRKVWFSEKRTQGDRAQDVLSNAADTDMTPEMIDDVRSVKTFDGKNVFGWGGSWTNKKDPMHFHIDVTPQELAAGIDPSTVKGFGMDLDGDLNGHSNGHFNGAMDQHSHDEEMNSDSADEILLESETMINESEVNRFRPFLDFIADHEGTANRPNDGYDTSLGYGKFTGGEKRLTAMTLDQINALQVAMLDHPANNFNSSALGRYQIVRKTLRGLRTQFGLSGRELYSRELQDSLAVALIKRRGRDVAGLRLEWASLQRVNGNEILKKFDARGTGPIEILNQGPLDIFNPDNRPSWEKLLEILGPGILDKLNPKQQPSQLVLKPGDRGPDVKALQEALSARDYQVGKIDGIYGTLTTGAVAAFQADYKVPAAVLGSVDGDTWSMLRDAPGRPLSQERINATADDLRRMGSRTIAEADNARLMAVLTSLLGVLGLGNSAIREYSPATPANAAAANAVAVSTAPADQQIAHALNGFQDAELRTFFNLGPQGTNTLALKIRDLEKLYVKSIPAPGTTTAGTLQDLNNPLVQLISTGANILLPGAGGSLAILALGIASHIFGTRVIKRRVQDQRNGSNIGAHIDRK
jgi:peptidoglycan hydrolase-like protein with peptidoglycan-binding domain/muramidase (phage lysozyme)